MTTCEPARTGTIVLAGAVFAVLTGCTSTTALQTASTVDPDTYRVGVQLSTSPYCSLSLSPLTRCGELSLGAPLPELRVSGRYGFAERWDVGVSAHGVGVIPRGFQLGLLTDVKREVWSHLTESGRRHLLALSVGADLTGVFTHAFTSQSAASPRISLPAAAWYGYQLDRWELLVSPRFVERLSWIRVTDDQSAELIDTGYVGLMLGALTRGDRRYGVSLEYLAPTGDLTSGRFTLAFGILWDLRAN